MRKNFFTLTFALIFSIGSINAQNQPASNRIYSILIKGGHVIDPKNNIDGLMDIAIHSARSAVNGQPAQEARIALVARNIDTALAFQVVDAKVMFVTPGIIDSPPHVF